ncbi:MAG: glycerol kinase GlpK [Pseudomonadales bacterium]|jgi:glycerol kinase|nr:glycerol kinase GlpK [Pseudomonadales bacterium]MDP6472002.1 glycerol kinase GlpK [Pseudomonadales bacterium]MDP6826727.1 glycerol kinase GlpK [Pseudomonadales bacterium]MDP6972661.1 glycerol kinase GlpK [Pseudomonadales bacterium]|tara:strand:+ start:420 stop:1904 length:1485 start_codon:yes stop_codon:yes gene_type:complete
MTYILALDQGTSSSRAIVFDERGEVVSIAQESLDMIFPADGWVEQDPEALWQSTLNSGRAALAQAELTGSDIAAIGITNQRETTLVWDKNTGDCVANAVVWQDRRTAARCEEIEADGMAETIAHKTGLVVDPYFSATKLAWLLDGNGSLRTAAQRGDLCFGTVDSFLLWRLTKGRSHKTDATNASRTMLFDIRRQQWDEELCRYLNVPADMLPAVCDSAGEFGVAHTEWFGAPIPVTGIAGDQQSALIGQACFEVGMSKSTYGTGCFLMTNTGPMLVNSSHGLLTTVGYRIGGQTTYALEGSIFVAGVAVKWLRDKLRMIDEAGDTEGIAEANGVDTGGVYVVPAFTGLGAPYWEPDVRGTITGMTLDTSREQIVTATLQSVAYQTAELVDAMAHDGPDLARVRVDGGMVVNDWVCQFLADILDVDVERPAITETTALGAASLASVGAGLVGDLQTLAHGWRIDRAFHPGMPAPRRAMLLDGWKSAVARARYGA